MLLGYVEFILFLFLPGIALTELLKLGDGLTLIQRLSISFALGVSIDVIILLVKTSGISLLGFTLEGISSLFIQAVLAFSIFIILLSVAIRRKSYSLARPTRNEIFALFFVFVQALLVLLHFLKYPIFPEFQSIDFEQHVRIVQSIISSGTVSISSAVLYYGVHLLIAAAVVLTSDLALAVSQYAVWILLCLSPLLVYTAQLSLTHSERTALITELLYVITGFVWFGSVFNSGLYPNFYAFISMLSLLAFLGIKKRSASWYLAFFLVVLSLYLSHYSVVTVFPAVLLYYIINFVTKKKIEKGELALLLIIFVPGILGIAFYQGEVGTLLGFLTATGGGVLGDTQLSSALSFFPALRFMVAEVTNDVSFILLLLLAFVGSYGAVKKRDVQLIPLIWLLSILAVAPNSDSAWRFSYVALLPFIFVSSYGLDYLMPSSSKVLVKRKKGERRRMQASLRYFVIAVIIIACFVNSWSYKLISDSLNQTGINYSSQYDVYSSMLWFENNTKPGTPILSVTDWRYIYSELVIGRTGYFAPLMPPDLAVKNGFHYVAVTHLATLSESEASGSNPFDMYGSNSSFALVYSNNDVSIYNYTGK